MIRGVVSVLVTPLDKNLNVCKKDLERLIKFQIDSGIAAFWALGSTGEDISLGRKTKFRFAELLAEVVDSKIPVVIGSGENSIEDNIDFFKHCQSCGISSVSYIHRDTKQGSDRLIASIEKLADKSPLPIYLYNNVQRGKEIDFSSLLHLSKHANIKGVKYGGRMHMPFIKACSINSSDFQVLSAGNFFFSALCYGLTASTTSDANFLPSVYVRIKSLFDEGSLEKARELQQTTINLLSKIPRTDNGESSSEIKYILSKMGLCSEFVNRGYRKLSVKEKTQINSLLPHLKQANDLARA